MSTPGAFATASAVTASGDGRYTGAVAEGWDIAGNADGGYLCAIAAVDRVEMYLHPDDVPFRTGDGSGNARMRGWFRLRDGEPLDSIALVLAADSFPPTSFNANLPLGWTPTIELTVHVRARPVEGFLACSFVTRNISGGYLETDGELWDPSGTLVAQSRQLQLVPAPRGG